MTLKWWCHDVYIGVRLHARHAQSESAVFIVVVVVRCFAVWLRQVFSLLSVCQTKNYPILAKITIASVSKADPPSLSRHMTSKTLPKSSSDLPSSSNLFPLGQAALAYLPLETHLENKRLKGVNPLFSLPKLQEYSSTQDRLLLSLRPDAQCRSQDHSQVSVPGPLGRLEDEMPVVGSGPALQLGHHDGAVDQETLWEQVSSEHTMKLAGSSVSYINCYWKVRNDPNIVAIANLGSG